MGVAGIEDVDPERVPAPQSGRRQPQPSPNQYEEYPPLGGEDSVIPHGEQLEARREEATSPTTATLESWKEGKAEFNTILEGLTEFFKRYPEKGTEMREFAHEFAQQASKPPPLEPITDDNNNETQDTDTPKGEETGLLCPN